MADKSELNWANLDIETLPKPMQEQWAKMKEVYKSYSTLRDAFEKAISNAVKEKVPAGHEVKFGYRFGKLSVAVAPTRTAKAKNAVGLNTLHFS